MSPPSNQLKKILFEEGCRPGQPPYIHIDFFGPKNHVFAFTSRRRVGYTAGNVTYRFIQVKPERFFGVEKVWIGDARVAITDPERTLLDGLTMPQYCGDMAEVLHAFEVRGADLNLERIIGYALRLDGAAAKRLGWVLERQGVDPVRLERLSALPIKGYRGLDPTGPRRGPCNRRWMIQENLPGKISP